MSAEPMSRTSARFFRHREKICSFIAMLCLCAWLATNHYLMLMNAIWLVWAALDASRTHRKSPV